MKAYKFIRKISTPESLNNWGLMGSIISKEEDSALYRSYFKRLLLKQDQNPLQQALVMLILGNGFLLKQ